MAVLIDPLPRSFEAYRVPELLQDIRLLDLLELSGSTVQASRLLSLSQPTVSRRYRSLAQDFGLQRDPRQRERCRYGRTEAMRWLRLASRAHRLAAGYARIGADLIHQPLLAGMDWLLPTPVRFRSIHSWADLIREGVIDAALVSGLELAAAPRWDSSGLKVTDLGQLELGLAVRRDNSDKETRAVPPALVPSRAVMPGLYRTLRDQGLELKVAGNACVSPEHWGKRCRDHGLGLPTYASCRKSVGRNTYLTPVVLPEVCWGGIALVAPEGEHRATGLTGVVTALQALESDANVSPKKE
jgi:DNA-binding transcriptional LysR family regulator